MMLSPGDPVPHFVAATSSNPRFVLNTAAGRYLLLGFRPSNDAPLAQAMDRFVADHRRLFDDDRLAFFGVHGDPAEFALRGDSVPGVRWFQDADRQVAKTCGMLDDSGERPGWILIDPSFRILAVRPLDDFDGMARLLRALPPVAAHAGVELFAPVLVTPRIFEPDLCKALIAAYEADDRERSGFMREVDGKTVVVHNPQHKIRRDFMLPAGPLHAAVRQRITRRLAPEIAKSFQFAATRMERDLIACYDAAEGGFFRPHRDNTTKGTAHRRFAVTINLNAEDYDGGDLKFPEFGPRLYRAPTGGAVVFSCSLLHEATPVTRGRRYAFLPFLYDESAAVVRENNAGFVAQDGYAYRAHAPAEASKTATGAET